MVRQIISRTTITPVALAVLALVNAAVAASGEISCGSSGQFKVVEGCDELAATFNAKVSPSSAMSCVVQRLAFTDEDACATAAVELQDSINDGDVGALTCISFASRFALASEDEDDCEDVAAAYTCFGAVGEVGSDFASGPEASDVGALSSTRLAVGFTGESCERVRCAAAEDPGTIDTAAKIW